MILYGISNCDTVRKARKWLDEREIAYEFHDFKKKSVNPVQLRAWVSEHGWETILNKRGTTWRKLPEETRENMDETLALVVMEEQTSIIKRPILETSTRTLVGFKPEVYQQLLQN